MPGQEDGEQAPGDSPGPLCGGHSPAPVGVQHSDSSDSNDGSSGGHAEEAALAILGLLRESGRWAGESLLPPRSAGVRGLCLRRVTSSYRGSP